MNTTCALQASTCLATWRQEVSDSKCQLGLRLMQSPDHTVDMEGLLQHTAHGSHKVCHLRRWASSASSLAIRALHRLLLGLSLRGHDILVLKLSHDLRGTSNN